MGTTTLSELKNGEKAVVSEIKGGGCLAQRLNAMGIFPGKEIRKASSAPKGPVIIEVMRSKVALGRGMAEKIIVKKT